MNGTMNKKRIGLIVLTIALICALAVGGTLAYLTADANNKTNRFTFVQGKDKDGLNISIYEPNWDGGTAENPNPTDYDTEDTALGIVQATKVMPSMKVDKDPTIKNTGKFDVWAAVKMELPTGYSFENNSGKQITIKFTDKSGSTFDVATLNNTNAAVVSSEKNVAVIYIPTPVAAGQTADAVFTKVEFNSNLNNTQVKEMTAFDLTVSGYAVQTEGLKDSTCKDAINGAFSDILAKTAARSN